MKFSYSTPIFGRVLASIVMAAMCVNLAACSGSSSAIPSKPSLPKTSTVCPQSIGLMLISTCGGGTGYTPLTFKYQVGTATSSAQTTDAYDGTGSGADTSTGESSQNTASISSDVNNGISTVVLNDQTRSSQPMTFQYVAADYIVPGNNVEPNGSVVVADATTGNATETVVDRFGTQYSLTATLDSDGHDIDVSYTGSNGTSGVQLVDGYEIAPSAMSTATTQSFIKNVKGSVRKPLGRWAVTGAAVTVAGAAIAFVGAALVVAGLVAASPGLALGAAVVGLVGTAVALGGATIQLVDTIQDNKKKGKTN